MQRLITDNNVYVSFDLFDFTIYDFQTGIPLMRCDTRGDLYPIATSTNFTRLTSNIRRSRLGHPVIYVLHSFHNNKFIYCEPLNLLLFVTLMFLENMLNCHFFNSQTITLMPFDILHSDL